MNDEVRNTTVPPSRLRGETIVYFGPERWEGMWRNRHQLMSRLAADNTVIYVEPAQNFRPALRRLFGAESAPSTGPGIRVTEHESGVRIYHSPLSTPLIGRHPFRELSLRRYFRTLAHHARIDKSCRPIIWLSRPTMADYLGRLGEKLSIYHVVDEYSAYTGVDATIRDWLDEQEQRIMRQADAVIVVTPALFESKSPFNRNTYLVPNAVDYESYTNVATGAPADLAAIEAPVIGFTGLISARLDLGLIRDAARLRPEWSFVFIGAIDDAECADAMRALERMDNVHFLGVKPIDVLPSYLQRFDVCTIPYAADESAANASPLKLYEYAAVGRPIVTTDFAAARGFPGHLQRVTGVEAYVAACKGALALTPNDPTIVDNRRFAAENTWEHRVAQISDIMQQRLDDSGIQPACR